MHIYRESVDEQGDWGTLLEPGLRAQLAGKRLVAGSWPMGLGWAQPEVVTWSIHPMGPSRAWIGPAPVILSSISIYLYDSKLNVGCQFDQFIF